MGSSYVLSFLSEIDRPRSETLICLVVVLKLNVSVESSFGTFISFESFSFPWYDASQSSKLVGLNSMASVLAHTAFPSIEGENESTDFETVEPISSEEISSELNLITIASERFICPDVMPYTNSWNDSIDDGVPASLFLHPTKAISRVIATNRIVFSFMVFNYLGEF